MPASPVLAVSNLTITRDATHILRDIDWRVEPGQHWVILGANGSGKTSLLAALTGYLMPTQGDIELLGKRYGETDWRALRTRIGIIIRSAVSDAGMVGALGINTPLVSTAVQTTVLVPGPKLAGAIVEAFGAEISEDTQ